MSIEASIAERRKTLPRHLGIASYRCLLGGSVFAARLRAGQWDEPDLALFAAKRRFQQAMREARGTGIVVGGSRVLVCRRLSSLYWTGEVRMLLELEHADDLELADRYVDSIGPIEPSDFAAWLMPGTLEHLRNERDEVMEKLRHLRTFQLIGEWRHPWAPRPREASQSIAGSDCCTT